ncbi:histone-fold-containing protein [Ceratobasidium sp. AG-I]|nr:histone-fold-containing protein [Ceratobasidium sp. AG-I]
MPRLSQAATNAASAESQQEVVMAAEGIDNYELPKALVTRIAKSALPENAKMQKEALHAMLKGSTVFINYLAATAHELSRARGHKSVGAADVIKAIETIEFNTDGFVKFLEADLEAYRAGTKKTKTGGKAPAAGGKGKQKEGAPASGRRLKIVIAPIRDDEASPGPNAEGTESGAGQAAGTDDEDREEVEDDEDEEVGEDVDELEDDVEGDEAMEDETTQEGISFMTSGTGQTGPNESVDQSFRSAT